LGFEQKDTLAFGDGPNDVTMIQWAGTGIAVGEAYHEVLDAAAEHIARPEELGVARWLEQNLL
jgi:hydroxymethylpyrimidine pyrophosphatase-like HAD family hydrolase